MRLMQKENLFSLMGAWKDRSRQSLLFWLCALAAISVYAMARGSVKFAAGVLFCCALCLTCDRWKPRVLYRSGRGIIVLLWLVFGIVSALLLFFNANVGDVDFACYTNVLWNTLHGYFLHQTFLNQNLLAIHLMPAILIFVPFYALLGNYGLVIAQALAWAVGLWLLFSAQKPSSGAPLLLILAVASLPPLIAPLFFGFHPDILFFPASAWALYAYKKKSFLQFLLAVVFLVLIKEIFVLAALYFAFLVFWEKRPWYWGLAPAICSLLLVSFFWFVLSPALRSGPSHVFTTLLPASFNALTQQLISGNSLMFLLLSVFMVLPALVSHSIKFALFPLPFFLFYAVLPDQSFRDFWRHYALAGTWVALFSLSFCSTETLRRMAAPFFLISLCFSFSWIPLLSAPRASAEKRYAIKQALSIVSPDKKLVAHGPFIADAAERRFIMNWIYASEAWQRYDYLLFDSSYRPLWWSGRDSLNTHIQRLLESPKWGLVLYQEPVYLFKRNQL
jgi:uncharacterized membrane protein